MKIIINLFIIAAVYLFAGVTEVQNFYDNGNFSEAIAEARSSKSEYSDPELHLLWAKSAMALGHLDEAMSAYERVLILDETNVDAKVELAKVYNETSRIILAKETTKELNNFALTPEQRSVLELIDGSDIQHIKAKASLMLGHDSNINVSADADKLDEFYQIAGSEGEKDTLFTRFSGSVSYINDFDDVDGSYVRGDIKLYYQNNTDAHYYDMLIGTLNAGFGYREGDYNIYLPIGVEKVDYLDTFLMLQYKFEPKVDIRLSSDLLLNVNGAYKQRVYNDTKYKSMNDSSFSGGLGIYYLMDKDFLYLNTKYESFSSKENLHALYIDKDMLTVSLRVNYNLNSWLASRLDYRYRDAKYDDSRDDEYHQIELKLSHFFKEKYELFVSDRHVENSSNYIPANYSKNIFMLGISMSY